MTNELEKIVNYLVDQGLKALQKTDERDLQVDYLGIFSRDEDEFQNLEQVARGLGEEVEKDLRTGKTFLLRDPIQTQAGPLKVLKVRKPDPTRPQRGAPDFEIPNYEQFKKQWLGTSGTFTLMPRKDYEMIEVKGVDVLVYIPSIPWVERNRKKEG